MTVLVVVSIVSIVKNGGHLSLAPFEPKHITNGFSGLAAGFPLAIYLFIGWENSAALAEETDNPRRNVGRAVFFSISVMVVAYLLFAYATVTGFDYNVTNLSNASIPFITVAQGTVSVLLFFAFLAGLTSTLGALIAGVNSQARLIFNAGREGLLPSFIGEVHPTRRTPTKAIFTFVAISTLIIGGWGLLHVIGGKSGGQMNAVNFFAESSTMGTILILLVYLASNLALPFYYRKYRPDEFHVVKHAVLPIIGAAAIIVPLYYLAKPGQATPYDWFPYLALAVLVLSIGYAFYLVRRDPTLGDRVGSIVADAPIRPATGTGGWRRRPGRHPHHGRRRAGRPGPGYELKLNSYDLGVDIELYDAVQRLRFEHPEVRAVVLTSGKEKVFCAGANIRMLAASAHAWKVNFCKFTNETRNGIEDATSQLRPDLPRRGQRHRVRRRLRAGAGLRPHHAGRRPLLGGLAARAAAARRAAGHRRADPGRRQAQGAPRPGRLLLHQAEGVGGREGGAVAAGRRGRAAPGVGADRRRARRRTRRALQARPEARGVELTPLAKTRDRRRIGYRYVSARSTATGASPRSPSSARRRTPPPMSRRSTPRAPLLAAGGDPRARRPDPRPAHQRDRDRHLGAAHRRATRPGCWPTTRCCWSTRRRLAGQRDPALPQAHLQAPRRDQPQPDRADRAGQLLRRLAARARAGRRPVLPAHRRVRGRDPDAAPAAITLGPMNLSARCRWATG
jgi:hypothetical protein